MPELPDVEVYRSYLAHTVLHKKIEDIKINVDRILASPKERIIELKGNSFEDTHRHGKYCFLKNNKDSFLILHFGMTGDVEYYQKEDDPKNSALVFLFSEGHKFAFISIRKLGKVFITKDKQEFIKEKELGPDALSVAKDDFLKIIQSKRGMIKSALINQKFIAGIGNIYSDEILFQAQIHPTTNISRLDEKLLDNLYKKMRKVLIMAIARQAEPEKFPQSYLLPHRSKGEKCPRCGGEIAQTKVSGRTAYYCPKCQKEM